jgi:Flp pilus assembly protein TadD
MCLPHISLGKIYQLEGKLQDAVTQFEQARLIDPREKSGYSHLAVAYRRLGQFDKASAAVNALKAINDQERENPAHGMKSVDETSRASLPNDFK